MSRIIGLITGLYVEEWIEPAIKQALDYCDEVVVSIGPNAKEFAVLTDRSEEIADSYRDKVKLVAPVLGTSFVNGRGPTLNNMIKVSNAEVGDWVWLLDADEFYFPHTVDFLKDLIINEKNAATVSIWAKFFFINMTRYVKSYHVRLYKITSKKDRFAPSGAQSWTGKGERITVPLREDDEQFGMFHYSILTSPRYRRLMWDFHFSGKSGKTRDIQNKKLDWLENTYLKFDLDNEIHWTDKNTEMLGLNIKTPLWNTAYKPKKDGALYQYSGPQPIYIEEAGLHLVEDFRKFRGDV